GRAGGGGGHGQGAPGRPGEGALRPGKEPLAAVLDFFIERPVLSTVIALVMILTGALAALGLPIAQYPQVVPPQVTVTAALPGANAEIVSQSVAAAIEQQVNGSQDMLYMSSKSGNDGSYHLTVPFEIGTAQDTDQGEVQNH